MAEGSVGGVRHLWDGGTTAGLDDVQLLERFHAGRGEPAERAFEGLVRRHGPMVWRVCRRALGESHAAQDAFQATFLVLARRAGSIRRPEALASWLSGVARRVARRARVAADRRRAAERRAALIRGEQAASPPAADDLEALHDAIDRLPRLEREAIVLCDLDGLTYEAAARQLGCPLGTLSTRIKRGRARLRAALARRGLGDPAAVPIGVGGAAGPSAALVGATVRVVGAGGGGAPGVVPAAVAVLAARTVTAMRSDKLMIGALGLLIGAVGVGTAALAVASRPAGRQGPTEPPPATPQAGAAPARADDPAAAARIRSVRDQQSWIDRVGSIRITAETVQERPPAAIARHRRRLQEDSPGAKIDDHPDLLPRTESRVELAFDRRRIRTSNRVSWGVEAVRVFDGKRFIGRTIDAAQPDATSARIAPGPGSFFTDALGRFAGFRAGPHALWFLPAEATVAPARRPATPEDFVAAGRDRFDGTECDVFCTWAKSERFYIADGRLRGLKFGTQQRPDSGARLAAFLRRAGFDARDEADIFRGLSAPRRRDAERTLAAHMLTLTDPGFEVGLEDYREVAPGSWFPWREVARTFSLDEQGRTALDSTQTMTVTEVEVDRPLAKDLFALAIPDGARVIDQAAYPPLNYVQQADRTAAEWAEIVAQARTQAGRDRKYAEGQARLIGRPAPEFPPEALWLHGAPARWADLLGQVVVLDFWSEWCLPCRGDLPTLGRVHRDRAANGLTVIGIHTSGSDPAAIDKILRDFDLNYPTCIDVAPPAGAGTWGAMFASCGVEHIPHAVLVDRQGRIAATGPLNEVLAEARELTRLAP